MINWYSVMVEMQRRQDEMARAAERSQNKHIMNRPNKSPKDAGHIMAQLLIQTGTWLINTGNRFQEPCERLVLATRQGLQQDHIMTPHKAPCT
ncbi:MAG: hypothetical protein WAM60_26815 [Candidatus Promineifilaceae bacterium]